LSYSAKQPDLVVRELNETGLEQRVVRKVTWRLLPFLSLLYFMAQLDRVNVSFAALTMNKEIGLSATLYGWGAGIFFFSYVACEVPSNLALERFGARLWIARIMLTWGLLSAAMALVSGPVSFFAVRFLLGAAEAGLFPGVILYMTYWFPRSYRARVVAIFSLATPISTAVGSLVSAPLLAMNGIWGLTGWQWLFVIEGLPSVILALVTLRYLTDRPKEAEWLDVEERGCLTAKLAEEGQDAAHHHVSLRQSLRDPRLLLLMMIWLCRVTCLYGVAFFLPQVVKTFGGSDTETAIVSAIPFAVGSVGMLLFAWNSDRTQERRWHLLVTFALMAGGLVGAGLMGASLWTIVPLAVATIGYSAMVPCFWPLPSQFLTGTAAAGGIAFINAVGNIGGFVGPYGVGWLKDATNSFAGGLYFMGAIAVAGGVLVLFIKTTPSAER